VTRLQERKEGCGRRDIFSLLVGFVTPFISKQRVEHLPSNSLQLKRSRMERSVFLGAKSPGHDSGLLESWKAAALVKVRTGRGRNGRVFLWAFHVLPPSPVSDCILLCCRLVCDVCGQAHSNETEDTALSVMQKSLQKACRSLFCCSVVAARKTWRADLMCSQWSHAPDLTWT
jgi:hypothetical protein